MRKLIMTHTRTKAKINTIKTLYLKCNRMKCLCEKSTTSASDESAVKCLYRKLPVSRTLIRMFLGGGIQKLGIRSNYIYIQNT